MESCWLESSRAAVAAAAAVVATAARWGWDGGGEGVLIDGDGELTRRNLLRMFAKGRERGYLVVKSIRLTVGTDVVTPGRG